MSLVTLPVTDGTTVLPVPGQGISAARVWNIGTTALGLGTPADGSLRTALGVSAESLSV